MTFSDLFRERQACVNGLMVSHHRENVLAAGARGGSGRSGGSTRIGHRGSGILRLIGGIYYLTPSSLSMPTISALATWNNKDDTFEQMVLSVSTGRCMNRRDY